MRISDIRATTVSAPLEAPLRHSNGAHWGRFVRTIVQVETDEGLVGLGEMGGGGESAEQTFRALRPYLIGHNPFSLEELGFKIANPTASLYNNRTQVLAAIEFACLDIMGKALGVPVYQLFGGELGIQLATMLHLGAVLSNLTFSADAHYHHLRDDIIAGGKFSYVDGCIEVPDGPGLGVTLDPDKLGQYAEEFKRLGGYPYDRDPARPGWFPLIPNDRWANPNNEYGRTAVEEG
ncbi:enolase C-terminal domain-like protein [Alicyclobacillus shizuokensis]|uniref:enolase C-terminal domain-like protein n=1 Tax=Alicyclobacillus shizuokensis TaxID=392014 RepID=UPI0008327C49|nr:enolase C-terminal domain-like protein [Alicyclobacillus shizuokensis]